MALSAVEPWSFSLDWAFLLSVSQGNQRNQVPSIHYPLSNPPNTRKNLQLKRGWRVIEGNEGERGGKKGKSWVGKGI